MLLRETRQNRIIPDAIKSILNADSLKIRNSLFNKALATRLDPLFGYLNLIEYLEDNSIENWKSNIIICF